jgi:serine/threonine-protein kinase RsbT
MPAHAPRDAAGLPLAFQVHFSGAMSERDAFARAVQAILERYLSPITAHHFLKRFLSGLGRAALDVDHLAPLLEHASRSLRLFLEPQAAEAALAELRTLAPAKMGDPDSRIEVNRVEDIVAARLMARKHCARVHASNFVSLCVLTVVSELARNIANYSRGGYLEFRVDRTRITIVAVDSGPGIEHLDQILLGRYRPGPGRGRGLIAVKQTAAFFDVQTTPSGTRVEAAVAL